MNKSKAALWATVLMAVAVFLGGCRTFASAVDGIRGEGDVVEEAREVSGFTAVQLAGIGNVIVQSGEREGVLVEAQANLLPYLQTTVEGDTLVISIEDGANLVPTESIRYIVTAPEVDRLVMSGLGEIRAANVSGENVDLEVTGGGNIHVDEVRATNLTAVLSGLGDLTVDSGEVQRQTVRLTGGGSYNAPELASDEAAATISGLGSATLRASERLDATISGGGNISYHGRPQVRQTVTGLGQVRALDE